MASIPENTPHSRNLQVAAYRTERDLKFHEHRMLELIAENLGEFDGRLIDVGCASGTFLGALRQRFPAARLEGLELDEEMIALAEKRLAGKDVNIIKGDAFGFKPAAPYDAVMASGIFSVFEDPLPALENWVSWLKPEGVLFIFTQFNTRDIDTRVYYRSHYNPQGWETGLSSYAIRTVSKFLDELGCTYTFERFHIPIDIPESDDPCRSYTVTLDNGERMILYGGSIVSEQFFLTVRRKT